MSKHVVVTVLAVLAGLSTCGTVSAQEGGLTQAAMWASHSDAATDDFAAAIVAQNPDQVLALLSKEMPDMVSFGSVSVLGEVPYRISSNLAVSGYETNFTVIFDTSDGTPFIGVNAFPGEGGGPTKLLCFEVGNSLSGNMPIKVPAAPFSVVYADAKVYNDESGLLLHSNRLPYAIKSGSDALELNVCFYHLDGTPVGSSRAARMELRFTTSTDVIFRNGFE